MSLRVRRSTYLGLAFLFFLTGVTGLLFGVSRPALARPAHPYVDKGIYVVGNGGGLAEMQFLRVLSDLQYWVQIAWRHSPTGHLSVEQKAQLGWLVRSGILNTEKAEVALFSDPRSASELARYANNDYQFSISSPALYIDEATPRSWSALAQLAFQAWLEFPSRQQLIRDAGYKMEQILSLKEPVFSKIHSTRTSVPYSRESLLLHWDRVSFSGRWVQDVFSVEWSEVTVDLSEPLFRFLASQQEADVDEWQIQNIWTATDTTFVLQIQWSTARTVSQAQIAVTPRHFEPDSAAMWLEAPVARLSHRLDRARGGASEGNMNKGRRCRNQFFAK